MNDSKKKKLILWDVAGTLVTFRADLRAERIGGLCGADGAEMCKRLFADEDSPGVMFDRGEILASEFFDRCCEIMDIENSQENAGRFRHAYEDIFEPRPEVESLLEKLCGEYEMWLCSNTNVWHLDKIREVCPYIAKHCWKNCNSFDVGYTKPSVEVFKAAIERSGRPAEMITFIDDKPENVESAREAGLNAILFTSADEVARQLSGETVGA